MSSEKSSSTKIKELLSNQFVLLIVGALISSLIIPWFFQVWQDYQKELEIKTDLVGQISESVTIIVMLTQSVLLANNRGSIQTNEELNELFRELNGEYREWEISSAVIGSELQAYFPHTDLSAEWGSLKVFSLSFSENVTDFYRSAASVRVNSTERIDFSEQREKLLQQKDEIIQRILNSDITSFTSTPFQIFG